MNYLEIPPMPSSIVKRAKQLEVVRIEVALEANSDEAAINIAMKNGDGQFLYSGYDPVLKAFEGEIMQWIYETDFGFGGDGFNYGYDVCFDLVGETVSVTSWEMERVDGDEEISKMELLNE